MPGDDYEQQLATDAVNADPEPDGDPLSPSDEGTGETPGEASPPAPPAPPAWQAPPREQWEAMQRKLADAEKYATIGQEFAPHADRIRQAMFQPPPSAQAGAGVAPEQALSPYDRDYENLLSSQPGYVKFWKDTAQDPRVFERGVLAIAGRKFKAEFDAIKSLKGQYEKDRKELDRELAEMRGFRRVAEHRFAETPRWKQHGATVQEMFEKGWLNPQHPEAVEKAFEWAEQKAKAAGATPAQAKAAGNAAAAQVASAGAGGALPPLRKPGPREDPSLGGKRPAKAAGSGTDESARKWLKSPKPERDLATWAYEQDEARTGK